MRRDGREAAAVPSCFKGEKRSWFWEIRGYHTHTFPRTGALFAMQHNGWDRALKVTADGTGRAGQAGAVLLRKAADQAGLTGQLSTWMLPGGHGSADLGLGMNRAPDQLYQRSWLSGVCAGCGLADNDVACFPSGPGGAAPGTGPRADGPGRIGALTGDRQLRLP
jgi:hypothetical protein